MSGTGCATTGGLASCSTAAATGASCSLNNRRATSQAVSAMAMNPSHRPKAMLALSCTALSGAGNGRRGSGRWGMAASWRVIAGKGRLSHED
ncbi:hypothetical protein D3C85_1517680 [compost metagenome]